MRWIEWILDNSYMDLTTSLTMIAVAAISAIPSILNGRKANKLSEKVDDYHKDVNGKVTELIATTSELNIAAGHAAGVEDERKRSDPRT